MQKVATIFIMLMLASCSCHKNVAIDTSSASTDSGSTISEYTQIKADTLITQSTEVSEEVIITSETEEIVEYDNSDPANPVVQKVTTRKKDTITGKSASKVDLESHAAVEAVQERSDNTWSKQVSDTIKSKEVKSGSNMYLCLTLWAVLIAAIAVSWITGRITKYSK